MTAAMPPTVSKIYNGHTPITAIMPDCYHHTSLMLANESVIKAITICSSNIGQMEDVGQL